MTSYRPICDTWFLARAKLLGGETYYGAYPGGFLERARVLLGAWVSDPVLHVCGGKARYYPYRRGFGPNDKTLDLDPALGPDYLQSCTDPLPKGFRAILADPPYSPEDAEHYVPGARHYPPPGRIVARAIEAMEIGGKVGVLHYFAPTPPKNAMFIADITVVTGFNNRNRVFSVYERIS